MEPTELVAYAMKDGGRGAMRAIVGSTSLWSNLQGISSLETPISKTDAFMDSYDSRNGTYASQVLGGVANGNATFQTNGSISLGSGSLIHGNVRTGAAGALSVGPGTRVSGSVSPLGANLSLPAVDVPEVPMGGALSASGNYTLAPGTYGFDSVTVERGATFLITGPATIVVNGDFDLKRADLIIDPRGEPVEIYLAGDFHTATKAEHPGPSGINPKCCSCT